MERRALVGIKWDLEDIRDRIESLIVYRCKTRDFSYAFYVHDERDARGILYYTHIYIYIIRLIVIYS